MSNSAPVTERKSMTPRFRCQPNRLASGVASSSSLKYRTTCNTPPPHPPSSLSNRRTTAPIRSSNDLSRDHTRYLLIHTQLRLSAPHVPPMKPRPHDAFVTTTASHSDLIGLDTHQASDLLRRGVLAEQTKIDVLTQRHAGMLRPGAEDVRGLYPSLPPGLN